MISNAPNSIANADVFRRKDGKLYQVIHVGNQKYILVALYFENSLPMRYVEPMSAALLLDNIKTDAHDFEYMGYENVVLTARIKEEPENERKLLLTVAEEIATNGYSTRPTRDRLVIFYEKNK